MSERRTCSMAAAILSTLFFITWGMPPASAELVENAPPDGNESTTKPPTSLGTSDSNGDVANIPNATAEVLSVGKSNSGNLASITIRITNNGEREVNDNDFGNPVYIYREDVFSGVTLLDSADEARHNPIMDEEGYCSCAGYAPRAPYAPFVRPGESIDYWAMYSLPADTKEVTVEIPGFDPIEDVPVG